MPSPRLDCCARGNTVKPRAWLPGAAPQTYATCLSTQSSQTDDSADSESRHPPPSQELVMTQRVNYVEQSPELFKKFVEFLNAIKEGAIEEPLRNLVSIRTSQLN